MIAICRRGGADDTFTDTYLVGNVTDGALTVSPGGFGSFRNQSWLETMSALSVSHSDRDLSIALHPPAIAIVTIEYPPKTSRMERANIRRLRAERYGFSTQDDVREIMFEGQPYLAALKTSERKEIFAAAKRSGFRIDRIEHCAYSWARLVDETVTAIVSVKTEQEADVICIGEGRAEIRSIAADTRSQLTENVTSTIVRSERARFIASPTVFVHDPNSLLNGGALGHYPVKPLDIGADGALDGYPEALGLLMAGAA